MGEEYVPEWKKIIISKNTNNWPCSVRSGGASNFHTVFCEVKLETDDDTPMVAYEETVQSEPLSPESIIESDDSGGIRRRRRGSGPKNESPEERSARLNKMSAYAANRLASETAEQRASRLKRMSEYAAKRLAQETSEQRAKRLSRMSAYAAKRLAQETPEQRQARLARMSAYAARRQAMKKGMTSSVVNADDFKTN